MNKVIAVLFSLLYAVVACFLALVGSFHGPGLFPYFVLCLLAPLLGVWWWLCFFLPAHKPRYPLIWLILCGVGLGVLLIEGIFAGQRTLAAWEFRRMEKRAAATQVADMRDEPLLWKDSAPIGIRLRYSLRFPDDDYFWQSPSLFPSTDLGYTVGWNIVGENIEPPLRIVKPGIDLVPIEAAHLPPDVRRYERGKLYHFTVDLVPDFLALSSDGANVCVVRPAPQFAARLEKLLSRDDEIPFMVTVSGTNFRAPTRNSYGPKIFYDAAIKNGATDCKYLDGRISFHPSPTN
jgi:hypothetical protein